LSVSRRGEWNKTEDQWRDVQFAFFPFLALRTLFPLFFYLRRGLIKEKMKLLEPIGPRF
jgi:hypothetical protein